MESREAKDFTAFSSRFGDSCSCPGSSKGLGTWRTNKGGWAGMVYLESLVASTSPSVHSSNPWHGWNGSGIANVKEVTCFSPPAPPSFPSFPCCSLFGNEIPVMRQPGDGGKGRRPQNCWVLAAKLFVSLVVWSAIAITAATAVTCRQVFFLFPSLMLTEATECCNLAQI